MTSFRYVPAVPTLRALRWLERPLKSENTPTNIGLFYGRAEEQRCYIAIDV